MAVDDYYELLGVAPDAPTDEIRAAYREKRDALSGAGRDEAARVNRAWNVLSDPYQRGRYDEQLAQARLDGLEGSAGDDGERGAGAGGAAAEPPRRRRLFEPPGDRTARPLPARTVSLPEGVQPAERRARVLAMVFDLTIVVAIAIGSMLVGQAVLRDRFPDEIDRSDEISDEITELDDDADAAADRASELDDQADQAETDGDAARAQDLRDDARAARAEESSRRDEIETLEDEQADIASKVQPTYLVFNYAIPFVLGVAYLVPPSALTGQTLGKRLRRVRAVRADGSPIGWLGATIRYGAPAAITVLLAFLLGPLALLVVLFGVLSWMRNPNEQGLHDRMAKTVVVGA